MQCNELNTTTRCAAPTGEVARDAMREEAGAWFRAPVDVIETEDQVIVRADVPGVSPRDVGVHVRGETLELHAPVHRPVPEGARVFLAEYGVGDWRRSLRLAPTIDRDGISARCADGVLEVRLPKRREAQRRRIEVRTN